MDNQSLLSTSFAPGWAIFAGDLGRALVIIGALAFLGAVVASFAKLTKLGGYLFALGSLTLLGAFVCLASLFVGNQFEYAYVFEHGDALNDFKYQVAGVWSGQQGSFLLWACTSAIFGMLALRCTGIYRRWFLAAYSVFLGSLCGILAYETPFKLLDGVTHDGHVLLPTNGAGLAASLQNYWVVIHPPTIFTGFGSLTVLACFALSAMLTGNQVDWIRLVRPWALVSLAVLGLGICMGGLWAYETLGWGGFWAWDPVENTSFVPWLMTVAFVHGIIVQATRTSGSITKAVVQGQPVQGARGTWTPSNLLMGGLPFITFCYGTFLTRSGFLASASVHSFAEMNRSALWILLAFMIVSTFGFLAIWIWKAVLPKRDPSELPEDRSVTRESIYKLGTTLISLLGLTIAIGMSVPFFMAIANRPSKVVPEGLYHLIVVWFFVPIMLLVAIGPFVSWRRPGGKAFWSRVTNVFCVSIGLTGLMLLLFKLPNVGMHVDPQGKIALPFNGSMALVPWMALLTFLCMFALVANVWRIGELSKHSKVFSFGGFIAHIGLAVLMAGLVLSRGFERSERVFPQRDESVMALGYVLTPRAFVTPGLSQPDLENRDNKMPVDVANPDGVKFTAMPGLYFLTGNDGKPQSMRWPYIYHSFSHDIYLALGDPVITVWSDPISMKPGDVHNEKDMFSIKYEGWKMDGEPGQIGTKFVADLTMDVGGQIYHPKPALELGQGGLQNQLANVGSEFYVTMDSINAADKSATIQVYFQKPIFPMELFYKPLTSLVWLGAGILCLGGLMAAFYRRPRPTPDADEPEETASEEGSESEEHALVSAS